MIGEFSDGMLVDLDTGRVWFSAEEWLRSPDDWFLRTCVEFGIDPWEQL